MSAADTTSSYVLDRQDEEAIREIAETLVRTVQRDYPPGSLARRDAHPKHHGCVRAMFQIDPELPAHLRHGVFAEPRTFPAWIRFSNGAPHVQPDTRRDQRGMAIKLMDVPGVKVLDDERDAPTQDFVLASCPRFFIRSIADYVKFARVATKKPAFRVLGFFFGLNPFAWKMHELRALVTSLQPADNPLSLRYWSQTPYRLGPHVVKYSAAPIDAQAAQRTSRSADYLREAMATQLERREARFAFMIQRQVDPASTPLEDATVEWPETLAPFERVAIITIPIQRFESPEQMALAEHLSYTPWHTLPEHEPLGGINRTRLIAYRTISRLRHEMNGVPRREPRSLEIEPWWNGSQKD
jgi:Catalase